MANAPQPVRRRRPLVPTPTPLPTTGGPGPPPAKPVPHAPGAPRRAGLPAASPARPLAGAGPGGAEAKDIEGQFICSDVILRQVRPDAVITAATLGVKLREPVWVGPVGFYASTWYTQYHHTCDPAGGSW